MVVVPGTAVTTPSVLVTPTSTCRSRVTVSVAVLSVWSGSSAPTGWTVTTLSRVPTAAGSMAAVNVRVTLWPVARLSPVHRPVSES